MRALYVRPLTEEEYAEVNRGQKSSSGFTVRRSQMILLSAEEGLKAQAIGSRLGCTGQTVRAAIHAFQTEGTKSLYEKTHARQDDQRAVKAVDQERLREIIRRSPREFDYPRRLWSLKLLAQVSFQEGLTSRVVSAETMSDTLKRMTIDWRRVRKWITSPDPHYQRKKDDEIG